MEKNRWKSALTLGVTPKPLPIHIAKAVLADLPRIEKIDWPPFPNIRTRDPQQYTAWIAKNKPEHLHAVCQAYSVWRLRRAIKDNIIYTFTTS